MIARFHRLPILLLGMFLVSSPASAQAPPAISYQGIVADVAGTPVVDGSHAITVHLYETSNGGIPVWSETHATTTSRGLFNLLLGSLAPFAPLTFDRPYWLGVSIDGGGELAPRTPLASSPYALNGGVTSINSAVGALVLEGSGGTTIRRTGTTITISSTGGTGGVDQIQSSDDAIVVGNPNGPETTITLASGGVTTSKLADEAVTLQKLAGLGSSPGETIISDGTTLRFGLPIATGLVLPFDTSATSSRPLMSLTQNGMGGVAILTIANPASTADALMLANNGTGSALRVSATGSGPALRISGPMTQSGGSLLFNDTLGGTPAAGAGTRMMWIPRKGALRAGRVTSVFGRTDASHWNDSLVGSYSTAFGFNTVAKGNYSTALGSGSVASADYSTAIGLNAKADFASTGIGQNANASGSNSAALGTGATASGNFATAFTSATASGHYSTAMGRQTTSSGKGSTAMGSAVSTNFQEGSFIYGDMSTYNSFSDNFNAITYCTGPNRFEVRADRVWFGRPSAISYPATNAYIGTSTGAYLSNGGTWTNSSDRNNKRGIHLIDKQSVLERVATMPINRWSYVADTSGVEHIGPMAQDFHATFGLNGDDTTHIATVDADGVALAAIGGLKELLDERTIRFEADNAKQAAEIERLREELRTLRELIEQVHP